MEKHKWIEVWIAGLDLSEQYWLDLGQEEWLSTDDVGQELLDSRVTDLLAPRRCVFLSKSEGVITSKWA